MASKDTKPKRHGKKTKGQPKNNAEVSVPASEPVNKRACKRQLNSDGDISQSANTRSKAKRPEMSVNASPFSEPVKKSA